MISSVSRWILPSADRRWAAVMIQPSSLITMKAPHPQSVLRSKYRLENTTGLVKQLPLLQAFANMGPLLPPKLPLPRLRLAPGEGIPSVEGKIRPPGRLPRLVAAYACCGMNRDCVKVDECLTDRLILPGSGGGSNPPLFPMDFNCPLPHFSKGLVDAGNRKEILLSFFLPSPSQGGCNENAARAARRTGSVRDPRHGRGSEELPGDGTRPGGDGRSHYRSEREGQGGDRAGQGHQGHRGPESRIERDDPVPDEGDEHRRQSGDQKGKEVGASASFLSPGAGGGYPPAPWKVLHRFMSPDSIPA